MEGFKSAYRQGVSGFELDVFLTKDKKLVLFHDLNTLVSNSDRNQQEFDRESNFWTKNVSKL